MKLIHHIYRYLSAWCDLIDGIIGIITFGFWLPGLSFKFCVLYFKFECYLVEKYGRIFDESYS